ncbi:MAG: folate-binding protein [Alphaproteobacteria bacterium]|nr:folate-binding protein [Alphaproteobacteria bacterium]
MERLAFILPDRGVVEVKGPDASSFLQGLVTNDVEQAVDGHAVYAALLTPQGKVIVDFIVAAEPGGYLLDCPAERAADLASRLKKYKLRAKVEILDRSSELGVAAIGEAAGLREVAMFADPRLAALGARAIGARDRLAGVLTAAGYMLAPAADYDARRIELGVPEGADIDPESHFPLDCNFEELHGVDFKKGCYVGQELTARMKHRGTARKRILPVSADVALPPAGTNVSLGGTPIGELRASHDRHGLAMIRLDRLGQAKEADADGVVIRIGSPAYPLILSSGDGS